MRLETCEQVPALPPETDIFSLLLLILNPFSLAPVLAYGHPHNDNSQPSQVITHLSEQLQPAAMLADLTYLAHLAYSSLVLGVVFGSVKGALLVRGAAVDGGVTGGTYLKLSKLVKLDVDGVIRVPLALSLRPLGLKRGKL